MTELTSAFDALLLAKENIDIGHIGAAFSDGCVCGLCDAVRKEMEQTRDTATRIERKTIKTALAILFEGGGGAAINVIHGDYPELAEMVNHHIEQAKQEAFEEARLVARAAGEPNKFEKYGTRQLYWRGRGDASEDIRKLAGQSKGE